MSHSEVRVPPSLPPRYYLDYFRFVIDFVRTRYEDLLSPSEHRWIQTFQQLSEEAQCLFIRFCNRKGHFFRVNSLCYEEINDLPTALNELRSAGYVQGVDKDDSATVNDWISLFTKAELMRLARQIVVDEPPPPFSIRKDDLVRWLTHTYSGAELWEAISATEPVIQVNFQAEVRMIYFLFFGNRHSDMTEFVIRDLGHVRFEAYDDGQFTRRFSTREEAEQSLEISLTKEEFYQLSEALPPEEVHEWFMNWQEGIKPLSSLAQPSFGRFVTRVGAWLERQKRWEPALEVYQLTDALPSRERRVRLLQKLHYTEEAQALCKEIVAEPLNAEERFFADDALAKLRSSKKRIVKRTTLALQQAEQIELPFSARHSVEMEAIAHYKRLGFEAFFSENEPWRGLFGLLFWDIIFDTASQAIHHPLQRMPSDIFLPDFYRKRQKALYERCEELGAEAALHRHFTQTAHEKWGIANPLVAWYDGLLMQVEQLVRSLEPKQLHAILLEMARNLRENTRGFPDLLIWNSTDYRLIEIKSPSDHLSAQQLHWQYFFKEIGVNSAVVRVNWRTED